MLASLAASAIGTFHAHRPSISYPMYLSITPDHLLALKTNSPDERYVYIANLSNRKIIKDNIRGISKYLGDILSVYLPG